MQQTTTYLIVEPSSNSLDRGADLVAHVDSWCNLEDSAGCSRLVRSVGVALMYPSEFSPSLVATGSFQHRRSSSERDQFTAVKNVHKGGKYIRNSRLRQFLFGDELFKIGNRLVKLDNIDDFLPDRSTISSFWKFLLIYICFSLCRTADRSMVGSTGRAFFIHLQHWKNPVE